MLFYIDSTIHTFGRVEKKRVVVLVVEIKSIYYIAKTITLQYHSTTRFIRYINKKKKTKKKKRKRNTIEKTP